MAVLRRHTLALRCALAGGLCALLALWGCPGAGGGLAAGSLTSDLLGLEGRTTFDTAYGVPGTLVAFRIDGARIGVEALGGPSLEALDLLELSFPFPADDAELPITFHLSPSGEEARARFTLHQGAVFSSDIEGSSGTITITELSATQVVGTFELKLMREGGTGYVLFTNGRFRAPIVGTRSPTPTPQTPAPTPTS